MISIYKNVRKSQKVKIGFVTPFDHCALCPFETCQKWSKLILKKIWPLHSGRKGWQNLFGLFGFFGHFYLCWSRICTKFLVLGSFLREKPGLKILCFTCFSRNPLVIVVKLQKQNGLVWAPTTMHNYSLWCVVIFDISENTYQKTKCWKMLEHG